MYYHATLDPVKDKSLLQKQRGTAEPYVLRANPLFMDLTKNKAKMASK